MKRIAIIIAMLCLVLPVAAKQKAEIKSQWRGARVAYLGDSITDKRQVEKGQNETYWSYLEGILGTISYVYGISGHQWSQIPGQTEKLIAEHGQEVDAIMIFVGTNDYNANIPLGEWYTEEIVEVEVTGPKGSKSGVVAERKKRTLAMDNNTLRGRINIAMSQLKREYPTKQIILLTPIHRGTALLSDRNIQPDELYANGVGEYIDAYVEVSGPKGAKSAVVAERKKRTLVMDKNTLRGRINIAMSQLKHEYPTKQIILLTPIHRGLALLSDRNAQPDELHANGVGEYIDAYVDVVKEAGNVWAVPVIDLNSICGLYPLEETNGLYWRLPSLEKSKKSGKNRFDRLHPNSAGHLRMARVLAYQLLGYPAKLD